MFKIACVPAYNQEKEIFPLVKEIFNYVDKVIVCDDGSSDNTGKKARDAGAFVISHEKNMGKGAAMRTLFEYAKKIDFDILITIDGDGQFLPSEIPILVEPVEKEKYDVVIGNRFNGDSEMPSYRKFGNLVLDKMTRAASDLPFKDTQSGFRAYSRKSISDIKFLSNGFAADSEILVSASKKDLAITEKNVTVLYNTGGKTSTKDPITHSTGIVTSLIELIAIRRPLACLGFPGLVLMFIGLIYSGVVITIFNETRYFSIPSTLISLGSFVVGILMMLTAILLFSINRSLRR